MDCCKPATPEALPPVVIDCRSCGARGRAVKSITLDSLLVAPGSRPPGDYRFCPEPKCPVVYFHTTNGTELDVSDLKIRVGQKETAEDRPICYCFSHTAKELTDDVRANGVSTITQTIMAACKRGEDRCPTTNPQGGCCLGNVGAVVRAAK